MANTYEKTSMAICTGAFTNTRGVPTDPTTVTFEMVIPGQVAPITYIFGIDPQLIRAKDPATDITIPVGAFSVNWITAVPGVHTYAFKGTGAVQQAQRGSFFVIQSIP